MNLLRSVPIFFQIPKSSAPTLNRVSDETDRPSIAGDGVGGRPDREQPRRQRRPAAASGRGEHRVPAARDRALEAEDRGGAPQVGRQGHRPGLIPGTGWGP